MNTLTKTLLAVLALFSCLPFMASEDAIVPDTQLDIYEKNVNVEEEDESYEEIETEQQIGTNPSQNKLLLQSHLILIAIEENKIFNSLQTYAIELEERLKRVKSYVEDYEETVFKGMGWVNPDSSEFQKGSVLAANPFLVYRMFRRLKLQLPPVLKDLQNSTFLNGIYSSTLKALL